jgi:hypothetical protein
MSIIGVLFFFFVLFSAFFVLFFLTGFIPYWMFLVVKEWMSPTPEPEENEIS